jgi:Tfp pilus assembly protein PilO
MNLDRFFVMMATLTWGRVFLLSAALGAFYFFTMFNDAGATKTALENGQNEIVALKQQLKATREAIANADRFEQEVKATVDQFSKIIDYMPPTISTADLTTMLSEYSAKAGLRLVRSVPQPSTGRAEFYETTKVGIGLEGTYAQIVTFLSYLSQANKILTFEKIEIAPLNINNADLETPKLLFSGVLVGYRYVSSKKADESGKSPSVTAPAGGEPSATL